MFMSLLLMLQPLNEAVSAVISAVSCSMFSVSSLVKCNVE